MATQLRLLENQPRDLPGTDESGTAVTPPRHGGRLERSPARRRRDRTGATGGDPVRVPRSGGTPLGHIREPLDAGTRERGLRGVAEARRALQDANRRVAIRDAERRRTKQAQLVELAGRARVIASSPVASTPDAPETPHFPDGNAAA